MNTHNDTDLHYWIALLRTSGDIPPPSRNKIADALESMLDNIQAMDKEAALELRNEILRKGKDEVGAITPWECARIISADVRRLHRGRNPRFKFVARADRIRRLPETQRQIYSVLK